MFCLLRFPKRGSIIEMHTYLDVYENNCKSFPVSFAITRLNTTIIYSLAILYDYIIDHRRIKNRCSNNIIISFIRFVRVFSIIIYNVCIILYSNTRYYNKILNTYNTGIIYMVYALELKGMSFILRLCVPTC